MSVRKRYHSPDFGNDSSYNETNLKSSGLICLVCGAPATGFNFSVITCMCCKAFFRRNALFGLESYQCRYLTETCSINMRSRRDCSYCRLKKCFEVGMKKELILTEDVKRLKRERINANRQMTLKLTNQTNLLNEKDSMFLQNIFNCYEEYCRLPIMTFEKYEYELMCHQPFKSRVKLQHYLEFYQKHQGSTVNFFKHLPEFQQIPDDEQEELTMHNLRFLMRFNAIITNDDSIPTWAAVNLLLEILYGKKIVEEIDQCYHHFKYLLDDIKSIQIFLIILFFSTSGNYKGHLNTINLYKIQTRYTELLWAYLRQNYGEAIACRKLLIITGYCLCLQKINHELELKRQDKQWQELFISMQQKSQLT